MRCRLIHFDRSGNNLCKVYVCDDFMCMCVACASQNEVQVSYLSTSPQFLSITVMFGDLALNKA